MSHKDPYGDKVLDHYRNPRNYGPIEGADAMSRGENESCGDEVTIYLKVSDNRLTDVRFTSRSCAICRASASMLTELAKGKKVSEAIGLGRDDVLNSFGGAISPARESCALLPLKALKSALSELIKG
jgi:nitrogen fixation NifU-like protein